MSKALDFQPSPQPRRALPPPPSSSRSSTSDIVQGVAQEALAAQQIPAQESLQSLRQKLLDVEAKIQAHTVDPLQAYVSVIQEIGASQHPRVRLDIILKIAEHFLRNGKLTEAARGYNAAYQFAQEHLPARCEEVASNLLKPIQAYLQQMGNTAPVAAKWQQHRAHLAELREKCSSALPTKSVRQIQREISQGFSLLVEELIKSCMALLGPAPCKFCFISLGSLSRRDLPLL